MEETLQMDATTELDLALEQLNALEKQMAELRKDINYLKMEKLKDNVTKIGLKIKDGATVVKGSVTKAAGKVAAVPSIAVKKIKNLSEDIKLSIKQGISKGIYKKQELESVVKEHITETVDNIKENVTKAKENIINLKNQTVEKISSKVAKTAILPRLYVSKLQVYLAQKKVDRERVQQKKDDFIAAIKDQKMQQKQERQAEKESDRELKDLLNLLKEDEKKTEKETKKQERLQLRTDRVQKVKSSIAKTAIIPRSMYSKISLKFSQLKLKAVNKYIDTKETIETKIEEHKVAKEEKREERQKVKEARKNEKIQQRILKQQQKEIRYLQMEQEIMMNKEEKERVEEEFQALINGANENTGRGR